MANGPESKPQVMLGIVLRVALKIRLTATPKVALAVAPKVALTVVPRIARRLSLIPAPMLPARKTSPVS